MRIFDENKTREIYAPDMERGKLVKDSLFVRHHDAIVGREAQGHEHVLKEYQNGGKDIEWIVDVPAVEAKDAWDEYEDILVYVPYTQEELNELRRKELKEELAKIKEDIEQQVFGIIRYDYDEKKARAADIINELRVLEGKEPREVVYR